MTPAKKAKLPMGYVIASKYRVTGELGRGGMAAVYQAENVDIGKRVAIKVLAAELVTSPVVVERFFREARAAAAIKSPNICDVYDSGRLDDGRPFLVLELLEGESLYERMVAVSRIDLETTLAVVSQTCRGLTKAHAAGIVHRDLKPENIFLTRDEDEQLRVKILDFGLAKFYQPLDGGGEQARLTRDGAVFGTPAYMSPEQMRGQGDADARADLWALACIAYECLTGRTVWTTDQGVAVTFAEIAARKLPNPLDHRPDLPIAFRRWFERALGHELESRFQTARELSDALAAALGPGSPVAIADPTSSLTEASLVPEGSPPSTSDPRPSNAAHRGTVPILTAPATEPAVSVPAASASAASASAASASAASASAASASAAEPAASLPAASASAASTPATGRSIADSRSPESIDHDRATGDETGSITTQVLTRHRSSAGLVAVAIGALLTALGYFALRRGPIDTAPAPSATTLTTTTPPASEPSATGSASAHAAQSSDGPSPSAGASVERAALASDATALERLVASAQIALAEGDIEGARSQLDTAASASTHPLPRTLRQHLDVAGPAHAPGSACRLTGLARPRRRDLRAMPERPIGSGRPSLAVHDRSAVLVWSEPTPRGEQAVAVVLDDALVARSEPFVVSPEGRSVQRPEIVALGDRLLLTYWETQGPESGVYGRFVDPDAREVGTATLLARAVGGASAPTVTPMTAGELAITWLQPNERGGDELLLGTFDADSLSLHGEAFALLSTRASGAKTRIRSPVAARSDEGLHLGYRTERGTDRVLVHHAMPKDELTKPAAAAELRGRRADLSSERLRPDAHSIACAQSECFVVWSHEGRDGIWGSYLRDGQEGLGWSRELTRASGRRPTVASVDRGGSTAAMASWLERDRLVVAPIGADGLGEPFPVATLTTNDQPAASLVAGAAPGEWYAAWVDYEAGHLEPYAARVRCGR